MVAGPIKRYQDFLPKLRSVSRDWVVDWQRGTTRIFAGLVKKFAVADLLTAYTNHLNWADISVARRPILLLWLFAYGIKIYADFSAYSEYSDRFGAFVWNSRAGKLRLAVSADEYYGFLAALAHVAHKLADRLRLYSAGWIERGGGQVYANILVTMLSQRALAWRWNQFRRLGAAARSDVGRQAGLEAVASASAGGTAAVGADILMGPDVCRRKPSVGFLLHGYKNCTLLFQEASPWITR